MSRSGYDEGDYNPALANLWQGNLRRAIAGKRGQAFFRELIAALDALPEKKLVAGDLEYQGQYCALGALGKARGMDVAGIDPYDDVGIARKFDIPRHIACETMHVNDDYDTYWGAATPEDRFDRVRRWAVENLKEGGSENAQ